MPSGREPYALGWTTVRAWYLKRKDDIDAEELRRWQRVRRGAADAVAYQALADERRKTCLVECQMGGTTFLLPSQACRATLPDLMIAEGQPKLPGEGISAVAVRFFAMS